MEDLLALYREEARQDTFRQAGTENDDLRRWSAKRALVSTRTAMRTSYSSSMVARERVRASVWVGDWESWLLAEEERLILRAAISSIDPPGTWLAPRDRHADKSQVTRRTEVHRKYREHAGLIE